MTREQIAARLREAWLTADLSAADAWDVSAGCFTARWDAQADDVLALLREARAEERERAIRACEQLAGSLAQQAGRTTGTKRRDRTAESAGARLAAAESRRMPSLDTVETTDARTD